MRRGRLQPAITHVVLDEVFHTLVIALQPELVVTVRWTSSAFAYSICNSLRSCPCTGDDRGDVISALGGRTGLHALQIVGDRYFPSRSGFPVVFRRQSFFSTWHPRCYDDCCGIPIGNVDSQTYLELGAAGLCTCTHHLYHVRYHGDVMLAVNYAASLAFKTKRRHDTLSQSPNQCIMLKIISQRRKFIS